MAQFRKHSMASAIALAIGLSACGGGGGGGGGVSFIPATPAPPPPTPTPTPTPPPQPRPIAAAAMATVPNASLFPQATVSGPTMQAHAMTVFPLLETVVTINAAGLTADSAAMNGGATLAFESTGRTDDRYQMSVPGLGFTDVALAAGGWYCYGLCGGSVTLYNSEPATSNLSWTTFGAWDSYTTASNSHAAYVTGYRTPVSAVPTTGSATYRGSVQGRVMFSAAGPTHGVAVYGLYGDATLQANFASGAITGSLTNMSASGDPWNSVSLLGAISGGQNYFSGTSAATSAPAGQATLSGTATGTFAGMFFGPSAQEAGAVWTLHDGTKTAIGSFGVKIGP